MHQLGSLFLSRAVWDSKAIFLHGNREKQGHSYVTLRHHGLPERNLFAQISSLEIWSPNSSIISVFSGFPVQSHSVTECWGRERTTLSLGAEGRLCKAFSARAENLNLPLSYVATVTIIKFTDRRGTHTVFICCLHRRQQLLFCTQDKNCVFFTGGSSLSEVEMLDLLSSAQAERRKRHTFPDQVCSCWDFCHLSWYIVTAVDTPPLCLSRPCHIQNTESGAVADMTMAKLIVSQKRPVQSGELVVSPQPMVQIRCLPCIW